jgi:hypothetical protein
MPRTGVSLIFFITLFDTNKGPQQPAIPEGYTFLDHKTFVSSEAVEILQDLNTKAENRDPELLGLHIYQGMCILYCPWNYWK